MININSKYDEDSIKELLYQKLATLQTSEDFVDLVADTKVNLKILSAILTTTITKRDSVPVETPEYAQRYERIQSLFAELYKVLDEFVFFNRRF
jgi:hypothetical protein